MRRVVAATLLVWAAASWGWTLQSEFEGIDAGTRFETVASWFGSAGGSTVSNEAAVSGQQSLRLHCGRGDEGFGRWGGVTSFPSKLHKGDEVWWRVRTLWPTTGLWDAEPRLKFLRIHTRSSSGANHGYNDWYINPVGDAVPFQFIKEAEPQLHWSDIGGALDAIRPNEWETYELYVKFDDHAAIDGGAGVVRAWKNGRLLLDSRDHATLVDPTDEAESAYLFTYWNSDPFQKLYTFSTTASFTLHERVSSSGSSNTYEVVRIDADGIVLYDSTRHASPDFAVGQTMTGTTSGATAVITARLQPYPSRDVVMFVDDFFITNETPSATDDAGHAYIGVGTVRDGGVISTDAGPADAGATTSDAGSTVTDAGPTSDAGVPAVSDGGLGPETVQAGCGCTTGAEFLWLGAMALLRVRRRAVP